MKTATAHDQRLAKNRVAHQASKREELVGERAARRHVTAAELKAYTHRYGDASFQCSLTPAPEAE